MSAALDACSSLGIAVDEAGGPDGGPLALPRTEAEACELIGSFEDTSEGARLAPLGLGSSVDWCRPEQAAGDVRTLWLSTRSLVEAQGGVGVVEYVPGDGTLTALAGARMTDLRAVVAEGGHRITPAIGTDSTLGGVLAAGRSGGDRCAHGPGRHHVLGMRAVDGGGRVARSGGRLVKNVTGFDLHRLHVGARGTLGVVLEASLRLVPTPEAEALLVSEPLASDAEAVALALEVRADQRVRPRQLVVRDRRVHVVVAGRAAQVELERAAAEAHLGSAEVIAGDGSEERALAAADRAPAMRVLVAPSRVVEATRAIASALGETAGIVIEPDAAIVDLPRSLVDGHAEAWTDALLPALDALGARVESRCPLEPTVAAALAERHARATTAPERAWTGRLIEAFDPLHVLRTSGFPAGFDSDR
ncbi:MAG: FAD-binding protein [Planctomycetota bacterium]